jgi:hypothetical protein
MADGGRVVYSSRGLLLLEAAGTKDKGERYREKDEILTLSHQAGDRSNNMLCFLEQWKIVHAGRVIEGLREEVTFGHIPVPEEGLVRRERIRWHALRESPGYRRRAGGVDESGVEEFHTSLTRNTKFLFVRSTTGYLDTP